MTLTKKILFTTSIATALSALALPSAFANSSNQSLPPIQVVSMGYDGGVNPIDYQVKISVLPVGPYVGTSVISTGMNLAKWNEQTFSDDINKALYSDFQLPGTIIGHVAIDIISGYYGMQDLGHCTLTPSTAAQKKHLDLQVYITKGSTAGTMNCSLTAA